ncbi:MAG TPA: hypothetical protein PKC43_06625 [Phycisphaerales bacterium]|nr:hypothetical protein [Phycisphaerales bacterium]HMP37106.1 hypothetical protein [Phycisphaerales bacterium]
MSVNETPERPLPNPGEVVFIEAGKLRVGVRVLSVREHRQAIALHEQYTDLASGDSPEASDAKVDELGRLLLVDPDGGDITQRLLGSLSTMQFWNTIRRAFRVQVTGSDDEGDPEPTADEVASGAPASD